MLFQYPKCLLRAAVPFLFGSCISTVSAQAASSTTIATTWPLQTFVTQPGFHPPVYEVAKTGTTAPGYIFMNTDITGALDQHVNAVIVSDTGDLVYQAESGSQDFSVQTYNGQTVLVYWVGSIVTVIGRGYGSVVIMDTSYNVLYNISLVDSLYSPEGVLPSYIDSHEARISSNNTLLVTVYNTTQADLTSVGGTTSSWLLDSIFYEIDIETGAVLFEWVAREHIDQIPYGLSHRPILAAPTTAGAAWDWFHINSVEEYEQGFLVSSRHLWSILYISKATGKIIWNLNGSPGSGDFKGLPATAAFQWQHDARVLNSSAVGLTITILNNNNYEYGDLTKVNITNGLALKLNTVLKTVSVSNIYYDAADPIATVAEGSYQSLGNGNVLLNYGLNPTLIEYSSSGTAVWQAVFGNLGDGSYRGFRFPFVGTPSTKPDVVACKNSTSGLTNVWASWNGATQYTNFTIFGCGGEGVTVPRTGFETKYTGTCPTGLITANAIGPKGLILSISKTVKAGTC